MSDNELEQGPRCAGGVDTRARVFNLEKSDVDQWKVINSIRNRPPIWASLGIAALLGVIGYLVRAMNGG